MTHEPLHLLTEDQLPAHVQDWLPHLRMFADGQAMRYAAPVYLVGSALAHHNPEPRDWDVRCVLPDAQFELAYGPLAEWKDVIETRAARWRWHADCTKQTQLAWQTCPGLYVDFQALPESIARVHRWRPAFRLDRTPEGLHDDP